MVGVCSGLCSSRCLLVRATGETVEILREVSDLDIIIVNESGASVYSASKIAQEQSWDLEDECVGEFMVYIQRRYA